MTKTKSKLESKISKSAANNRKSRKLPWTRRVSASSRKKGRHARKPAPIVANEGTRPDTEQAQVILMLRAPGGTTVDAMVRSTGWQQHSVRGFLAAVVRKKLGLDLTSEARDSGRVYRIVDRPNQKTADQA